MKSGSFDGLEGGIAGTEVNEIFRAFPPTSS
jgi:hypothetical protein